MKIIEEQLSDSRAKSVNNLKDTEEIEVIKKGRSEKKAVRNLPHDKHWPVAG